MRFLLSPRWILGHVLVLVVVVACIGLGRWQLDRLDQRRVANRLIEHRSHGTPAELAAVAPSGSPMDADALSFRRVAVVGTYEPGHQVVLFGRSLDGQPGNHLLAPLRLADGRVLIVDRGWVPETVAAPTDPRVAPTDRGVRLIGVLVPPQASGGRRPAGGLTTVDVIDVQQLGSGLGGQVVPDYLWLQSQDPAPEGELPRPVPLPALSEGPHLSYAIQWFSFAVIAVIGYGVLIRKERRERAAQSP